MDARSMMSPAYGPGERYGMLAARAGLGRRIETAVLAYDGSNDPEVCCSRCGRFLGKDSRHWWDDYVCEHCHETRSA